MDLSKAFDCIPHDLQIATLHFADDNTIAVTCKNLNDLFRTLEKELESAVDWFKNNNMIANPGRFQAIIMNKTRENQITPKLKIYNKEIETTKSVSLLGIEIDNQLSFNLHISKLCSKAVMQLNAMCRLAKFMGNKEK